MPPGAIAASTADAVELRVESGGTALFDAALAHPASDPQWFKSKPPALFKYKDGGGTAGGLTLMQLKRKGPGYALKAKGRSAQLSALQGGAIDAKLVVGTQCYAATVACVKKGKGLRCK